MKFFTPTALLAAALVSAAVVVPFLPLAKTHDDLFALEVRLASTAAGTVELYPDSGAGVGAATSVRLGLERSATPVLYRLALPPGTYRSFRFDPIDRGGIPIERDATVTIASLRVVGRGGRIVRIIAFSDLKPNQHVQSVRNRDGQLEVRFTPGANDPQFAIDFAPPLLLKATPAELASSFFPRALSVFAALAALCLGLDRAPRIRTWLAQTAGRVAQRPGRAVAVVAAVCVVASAYPVVFLGKSYVSPNLGTTLLYEAFPTLPGTKSRETVDVKGTDLGAIMWSHIPVSMIQQRALAQGELPLWNRYNSAGTPLLGQGQSMFGDPLQLLVVLAKGAAWAWDLKYLVVKWLFATALGLLVLAVTRDQKTTGPKDQEAGGADPGPLVPSSLRPLVPWSFSPLIPSLLVTVAAPFLGFFYYRLNHPAIFSLCYAPWALYCWVRVAQAATRRAAAGWTAGLMLANLALMNSGTAKEAYMLLLCMNFSGACVLLADPAPWRVRLAKFAGLAWAGVLFVLLTAPIWATFLNTLKNAYTTYSGETAYQIQPGMLLGAFDEIFYRPLMIEERTFNPSVNFLILAGLLYFLATLRLSCAIRPVTALAASALVPLALAFGLVPASWIVQIPFLANVEHVDNTFSCALLVLWSVLAGVGFATAASRLRTPEGRGDLAVCGLLLFALVFAWIGFRQASQRPVFGNGTTFTSLQPGQVIPVSDFVWASLAVLPAAVVFLGWAARRALTRQLTPALGLMMALAMAMMLWRTGLHAAAVGFGNYVHRPTPRVNFQAKSGAVEFVRAAQRQEPSRGFGLRGNFFPGWTGVYGLETVHGPDALVNRYLRELVGVSGVEKLWEWRLYVEPEKVGAARPFLDALNVRWYLDLQSDQGLLGRSLKLAKIADLDVYESPTAWPRAFFTDRLAVYDQAEEFVHAIRAGDGRPFAAAQREVRTPPSALSPLPPLPRDLGGRTVIPATGYRLTENTTTFEVKASGPGVVVLNEVFWPGDDRAEINGRKAPVLRLNHAFKGVVVEAAGNYRVTFRYWPRRLLRNLLLCAAGAVLLAGSLVIALR
ncbi:MAG: hypothetical protein HY736_27710, partial [Verrucomicrobia bacterium]|nr:hypothetical protein [Verrucomicrobiota bacterium]